MRDLRLCRSKKYLFCSVIILVFYFTLQNIAVYAQQGNTIITARTGSIGVLSYSAQVTSSGLESGKYIDGYVKKMGTAKFIYPVGNGGYYRPFAADANGITGAYFFGSVDNSVNEIPGGPFPRSSKDVDIGSVSPTELWDINGSFSGKITLTWSPVSNVATLLSSSDLSKLMIVGWNGSKWTKIPATYDQVSILGGSSTTQNGSITTTSAFSPDNYSVYTLASAPGGPLPVTLVNFEVKAIERTSQLSWSTISEINSDRFEIERSDLGKSWTSIGSIFTKNINAATQNYSFSDREPLNGNNLYRLKMIDTDGTFAYSQIRQISFNNIFDITVYPNPATDKFYLSNVSQVGSKISLFEVGGKKMIENASFTTDGINVSALSAGSYIIRIDTNDGQQIVRKLLIAR
ncbi:T9SS type A sorting domain-containing protein [Dyadobacter sp. CY356]|uniref:T9SS type A sorting domain-containing protein n=1 Tax=Dyadobacter sp. CY356 TaxID=2906442 RepID=UPI001F3B5BB2|nr:T9SS type A sorting domain-containing protein [Dyadobacter sp. CY356]MCF0058330.1 T9SS type A sorting domain-containing protein [Dyadobacter sp. CY356]